MDSLPTVLLRAPTVLALLAPLSPAQNVRVLDATNGPYKTVEEVVFAAADGDIILVQPGAYYAGLDPVIQGISLHLIAADPDNRPQMRPLSIVDLGPEDQVTVRGIDFVSTIPANFTPTVVVVNNDGHVAFEDCGLRNGSFITGQGPAQPTLDAIAGDGIIMLTRCHVEGPRGLPSLGLGIPGLVAGVAIHAEEQSLVLFDTEAIGGLGGQSEPGADAIALDGSEVFVNGGVVRGGAGGATTTSNNCADAGDGGDGISGTGTVRLAAVDVERGEGGLALNSNCAAGNPGTALSTTGSVTSHSGFPTGIETTLPTVESGAVLAIELSGPDVATGSGWALKAQDSLGYVPLSGSPGIGAIALLTPFEFATGVLPTNTGTVAFPVQYSWTGLQEGFVVHAQAIFIDPGAATIYSGAPTHVTVTRPGFDPL